MKNLVSFQVPGEHQVRTGNVVKFGTKVCYVKERHVGSKKVWKLRYDDNKIKYLLGGSNPMKRDTFKKGRMMHVCGSDFKQKKRNYRKLLLA